jgi:hypothetical protein
MPHKAARSHTIPEPIRAHFMAQADACDSLGSPFTARLCRLIPDTLDGSGSLGERISNWPVDPRADALALRVCGGLHNLALSGKDPELQCIYPPALADDAVLAGVLTAALKRNNDFLDRFINSPPQTNEVARSGMLLPGFLAVARETGLPMDIAEIGASAGLNLLFDRFAYRYDCQLWGDLNSPVQLSPEIRGAQAPRLDGHLNVRHRIGCDIATINLSDEVACLRLQSYVWADQALRQDRLRGALALAENDPPRVEQLDARAFVERQLATRRPGATFVLFHSIMWQYMPGETRDGIEQCLHQVGQTASTNAPIAWLRMEPNDTRAPHATLTLMLWPAGETRQLARCDYHGRWIEWID